MQALDSRRDLKAVPEDLCKPLQAQAEEGAMLVDQVIAPQVSPAPSPPLLRQPTACHSPTGCGACCLLPLQMKWGGSCSVQCALGGMLLSNLCACVGSGRAGPAHVQRLHVEVLLAEVSPLTGYRIVASGAGGMSSKVLRDAAATGK